MCQAFAIKNDLSALSILSSILTHNSIYLCVCLYFIALKTKFGKKYFDYLNVICQDTFESCVQNYNFSSDLDGWSYGGTKPIVIDNTKSGVYAMVEKNGYLSQQVQLDSGNCYILRGIIKQAEPSLNSTSTISLNINYSLNGTQNIQRCITLNKNRVEESSNIYCQ